ncbi:hypothetical protein [Oscillibacter ruminantium]|jgi:uncharacterized coiled-coil protein SlyX
MNIVVTSIEAFFETYSFTKDAFLVIFGAVFGGICTVIINNGAMRKQCRFDMQYKILKEEADKLNDLSKKVEALEIKLSFGNHSTAELASEIDEIQHLLLKTNENLREKRRFVRKFLSAVIVEKTAQYVSDYMKILYQQGDGGIFDFRMVSAVNAEKLEELRNFETNIQRLSNEMAEAMESVIMPGIVSKVKRKLRTPGMMIEDCVAIVKVGHNKKKK